MYCSKCSLRNPIQSLIFWNAIFNNIQMLCLGVLCRNLNINIHASLFWWSWRYVTVPRPLYHASCKMFWSDSKVAHVYIPVKMTEFPRTRTLTTFFETSSKTRYTFTEILPHLGRSTDPSMNTDKKEFESTVITRKICTEVNNTAAAFSYARFSIR